MSRYERQLKRLVKKAGPDWEIVQGGAIRVGDLVIVNEVGPLAVLAIDPVKTEVPEEWGRAMLMNLGGRLAFGATTVTLMGRKKL